MNRKERSLEDVRRRLTDLFEEGSDFRYDLESALGAAWWDGFWAGRSDSGPDVLSDLVAVLEEEVTTEERQRHLPQCIDDLNQIYMERVWAFLDKRKK